MRIPAGRHSGGALVSLIGIPLRKVLPDLFGVLRRRVLMADSTANLPSRAFAVGPVLAGADFWLILILFHRGKILS